MEETSAKITFNFEVQSTDNEVENEIMINREKLSHYICYTSHKIDWSNTRIIKAATNTSNFIALTDDGKIYYTHNSIEGKEKECSIHQMNVHEMNIKEQITSISCGSNCYVIATNSRTFFWGFIYDEREDSSYDSAEDMYQNSWFTFGPHKTFSLTFKTIVKIVCGIDYTLALTNEGKLYGWGGPHFYETNMTFCSNYCGNYDILSPIKMNIINVKNLSDIAVINYTNFVKSSKNGLVYAWGFIFKRYKEPAVCEYTNAFDISNSMTARSPISVAGEFINEEFHILNDLETAFNDQSTSDLTIMVEKQSIYVHKVILKIRSTYFRSMFQTNYVENRQSVIVNNYYRYIVYKKFLEYLYIGRINLSSFKNLLDLLQLADALCEKNLQIDCIRKIKKTINVSNVIYLFNLIIDMNEGHHKEELMKYCFHFYFKNMTTVIQTDGFEELDVKTKAMLIDIGYTFLSSEINSSGYLE
ncbi:RCBT1 protein, partial [Acromyrmex charruanus]